MNYNYAMLGVIAVLMVLLYVQSGFWAQQPVFHIYDIRYYLLDELLVVDAGPPKTNRWTNLRQIRTERWADMSEAAKVHAVDFLHAEFHDDRAGNAYRPALKDLEAYMAEGGLVSWHGSKGLIMSRPVELHIRGQAHRAYYVDNFCVAGAYRGQHVGAELMQTHEYRQRLSGTALSLYRREGSLNKWLVPLKRCTIRLYNKKASTSAQTATVVDANSVPTLLTYLSDALKENDVWGLPSATTVLSLVCNKTWTAYIDSDGGVRVYKETGMLWQNEPIKELLIDTCKHPDTVQGWIIRSDDKPCSDAVPQWTEPAEWLLYNGIYRADNLHMVI